MASPPRASPQVVGNAFVTQYYQILHQQPEQVHKFYQDLSIVSRPGIDGVTTSVTTIQAINDKILSWDYSNCFTKIETVDSSSTYNEGVLVLVTGLFTTSNVKRKFAQTFFLAPQDNGGFFVLNDMFSLFGEAEVEKNNILVNSTYYDEPNVPITAVLETTSQENHITEEVPLSEVVVVANDEVIDTIEDVNSGVEGKTAASRPENASQNHVQPVHETVASTAQNDEPKKSYASILKVTSGSTASKNLIYVPTTVKAKVTLPTNKSVVPTDKAVAPVDKPVAKASAPAAEIIPNGTVAPEKNNPRKAEGYSIYIRNLPVDARPEEVEQEFKKFGTIKPGGVQVRNHKIDNFCFGFVEFDSAESMQAATKASPIEIRGYTAHIEQKRTATRVVNGVVTYNANGTGGRGQYQQGGRNGFRNDNFRGRGNFGVNVGYRRNDFRSRVDYNGRGRGYQQWLYQNGDGNGNGRVGHRLNGESKEIAAVA